MAQGVFERRLCGFYELKNIQIPFIVIFKGESDKAVCIIWKISSLTVLKFALLLMYILCIFSAFIKFKNRISMVYYILYDGCVMFKIKCLDFLCTEKGIIINLRKRVGRMWHGSINWIKLLTLYKYKINNIWLDTFCSFDVA